MIEFLSSPEVWAAFATLTLMEVVLGIDNVLFISILATKLPADQQDRARVLGLTLAAGMRLLLLLSVSWLVSLKDPFLHLFGYGFSGRDLILFGGGVFLVYKGTMEIHEKLEGDEDPATTSGKQLTFSSVIIQILMLDLVFSLDSVITAVGMTEHISIMVAAIIISLIAMIVLGKKIGEFVIEHPTVKMLALSFLLLIGVSLASEGLHTVFGSSLPKGYIYSAMAFSVFVETLNLLAKKRREKKRRVHGKEPVHLRQNVVGFKTASDAD